MLLAGIDASFDFDFNDYLHSAFLMRRHLVAAQPFASLNPDLFHFRVGNFLTSSVIIVSPVSGNKLRAHKLLFTVGLASWGAELALCLSSVWPLTAQP